MLRNGRTKTRSPVVQKALKVQDQEQAPTTILSLAFPPSPTCAENLFRVCFFLLLFAFISIARAPNHPFTLSPRSTAPPHNQHLHDKTKTKNEYATQTQTHKGRESGDWQGRRRHLSPLHLTTPLFTSFPRSLFPLFFPFILPSFSSINATATTSAAATVTLLAASLQFRFHLVHDGLGHKLQNVLIDQQLEVAPHLVDYKIGDYAVDAQAGGEGGRGGGREEGVRVGKRKNERKSGREIEAACT